jgi:hypothetical protein
MSTNKQGTFALGQLPERFKTVPRSKTLDEYISRKYGKYGFKNGKHIEFNREWEPTGTREKYRWVENVSKGLRHVGKASDIVRIDHTGWYTDNFQDETVHGEVYQMPARDGKPLYVPAVSDPYNKDCAALDFHSLTDDKEECARWADSMAENSAEREREYQAEESRKQRLADIETEIKELYTEFRRVSREIRANCDRLAGIGIVRELVRERWQSVKADIHKLRAERERVNRYGIEY